MMINKLQNRGLYVLSASVLILVFVFGCNTHQSLWPEIKETSQAYCFVADEKEKLTMNIFDNNGEPLYYLDVRFNAWKYGNGDYDFSGALDCRLSPVGGDKTYPSLFQNVKNATRDWQTNTRFLGDELIGLGLSGAPFSRSIVQKCKVRGMYIEIEINNVVVNSNHDIKSLNFKITFVNDPTATSEISDDETSIAFLK